MMSNPLELETPPPFDVVARKEYVPDNKNVEIRLICIRNLSVVDGDYAPVKVTI